VLAAQRRQARLVELGFDDLVGYLGDRVGSRGWSQRQVVAELRVGKAWLRREAAGLGFCWTAPRDALMTGGDGGRCALAAMAGRSGGDVGRYRDPVAIPSALHRDPIAGMTRLTVGWQT
jgi:hypothetical protein